MKIVLSGTSDEFLIQRGNEIVSAFSSCEKASEVSGKTDESAFTAHTSSQVLHLPTVSVSDNGKVLMVVNGQWSAVTPTVIYMGDGTPTSSQGNEGDIYLKTT